MNPSIDSFVSMLAGFEFRFGERSGLDANRVPLLTVGDAYALLDRWSHYLGQMIDRLDPDEVDHLVERWGRLVADAIAVANQLGGHHPHPDAPRVWDEVRRLAHHFDRTSSGGEGLADAWSAGWRNATMSVHGDEVKIDNVKDLVDLWGAMVRHFKETRGVVTDPTGKDKLAQLPRTTVGEVLWLADFWTRQLDRIGSRRLSRTDEAIAKWRNLVAHTTATAQGLKENDVYPENFLFWDGLGDYVIAIDEVRDAPVPFSWEDAIARSINALPDRLESAWDAVSHTVSGVASSVEHGVETGVKKGYEAVKTVASDVSGGIGGFFKGIGTPLLIGGAAILGLVVLVPVLSRK